MKLKNIQQIAVVASIFLSQVSTAAVIRDIDADQVSHFEVSSTTSSYFCSTIVRLMSSGKVELSKQVLDNYTLPNGKNNYGAKHAMVAKFPENLRKEAGYVIATVMCSSRLFTGPNKPASAPYETQIVLSAVMKDGSKASVSSGTVLNPNSSIDVTHAIYFKQADSEKVSDSPVKQIDKGQPADSNGKSKSNGQKIR